MKKTAHHLASIALLAGAPALCGLGSAQAAARIEHWTQPSGAQVYLVQSPHIPMLDVQIDFDAGSRRDPAGQAGLAAAAALMAGKGVAAQGRQRPALDENQLGQAWADLGASFGCAASADRTSCHLRTLTEAPLLDKSVQLASRQIGAPSFAAPVWQRERARWSAAIQEALTRPGPVANRAFNSAVYGAHPYGQDVQPQSLAHIDTAALRQFYASHILPCRAKVSLVGQVDRAQADALVTRLLSGLPQNACPALPAVPEVAPLAAARDEHIRMDSAQTHVLIGQPGIKRDDPDYFALLVGNHILGGGGFASRLMEQVREQRGLSYSVYSHFSPGLHAGAFTIGLQTRPAQAAQAVQLVHQVLAEFVKDGPTPQELQAAKDNLIGGFALRLDANRKLLGNVANIAWNKLPLDYLDHWSERVQAVSADDIRQAFARVIQPGRLATVVVGPQ